MQADKHSVNYLEVLPAANYAFCLDRDFCILLGANSLKLPFVNLDKLIAKNVSQGW